MNVTGGWVLAKANNNNIIIIKSLFIEDNILS